MSILKFELKKIIKNRLLFIYIVIAISFPIIMMFSNQSQLDKERLVYKRQFTMMKMKVDSLQLRLDEALPLTESEVNTNYEKNSQLLQAVSHQLSQINQALENESLTLNKYIIQLYDAIERYEVYIQQTNGVSLDIPQVRIDKERAMYHYFEKYSLSYESPKVSNNLPNFVYKISTIVFSFTGILLLVLMLTIPLILELVEGQSKLLLLECKKNNEAIIVQYFIFQIGLLLFILGLTFLTSYLLAFQFGEGLLTHTVNNFQYPVEFKAEQPITTIKVFFYQLLMVGLPYILLISQWFKFMYLNKMKPFVLLISVISLIGIIFVYQMFLGGLHHLTLQTASLVGIILLLVSIMITSLNKKGFENFQF